MSEQADGCAFRLNGKHRSRESDAGRWHDSDPQRMPTVEPGRRYASVTVMNLLGRQPKGVKWRASFNRPSRHTAELRRLLLEGQLIHRKDGSTGRMHRWHLRSMHRHRNVAGMLFARQ